MNVSKNIREGVRVCQNEDDWTAAPSDLRGIAIEYACYFSKKIQEVGRKRAICISPENVVSLLSTVRRAPDGALFSSPKGRFTVRAREKRSPKSCFLSPKSCFASPKSCRRSPAPLPPPLNIPKLSARKTDADRKLLRKTLGARCECNSPKRRVCQNEDG